MYPKFCLFEVAVQHLRIHFVDIDLDGEMVVYECPSGAVLESQRKSFHLLIKALCRLKRRRNLEKRSTFSFATQSSDLQRV